MAIPLAAFAQNVPPTGVPKPISLYAGAAPGAQGNGPADKPVLYPLLPIKRSTSAAILVIPGGGYQIDALGYEGFQIGEWLRSQGMPAFVLDYRVAPYHYPAETDDGERAMRLIRARAREFGIDPNRLGVWGFSAGGHLASFLGTHCDMQDTKAADPIDRLSCKPNFMVLSYPVITMEKPYAHLGSRDNLLGPDPSPELIRETSNELAVNASTPPTFLMATERDPLVPVQNTLEFYSALLRAHVPAELHLYDYSNHGCGLCGSILPMASWPGMLRRWFIDHSWLPVDAPAMPPPMPNWPMWPPGFDGPGKPAEHPAK